MWRRKRKGWEMTRIGFETREAEKFYETNQRLSSLKFFFALI